jgi:hypothetical protein
MKGEFIKAFRKHRQENYRGLSEGFLWHLTCQWPRNQAPCLGLPWTFFVPDAMPRGNTTTAHSRTHTCNQREFNRLVLLDMII